VLGSGLEGSRRLTADPANCPVSRDLDVEQKRTVQRIDPIAVYDYASGMQQKIVNELGRTDPLLEDWKRGVVDTRETKPESRKENRRGREEERKRGREEERKRMKRGRGRVGNGRVGEANLGFAFAPAYPPMRLLHSHSPRHRSPSQRHLISVLSAQLVRASDEIKPWRDASWADSHSPLTIHTYCKGAWIEMQHNLACLG